MSDRRKDTTEAPWSEYVEKERRKQGQLSDAQRVIGYLTQGIVRWLLENPSAEENVHVLAMQERLAELGSIIARRAKRIYSPEDGPQWAATAVEVRSLLKKTNIAGEELADQLPKKLPGERSKAMRGQRQNITRAIIARVKRDYPGASIQRICQLLDTKKPRRVPLPKIWQHLGFETWEAIWTSPAHRTRVKRWISGIKPAAAEKEQQFS